jgi:glutathione peroxidase
MKYIAILICFLLATPVQAQDIQPSYTIYQYKIKSLDGDVIDFSKFKGKKIIIVNTASKCGYTPQYEELEKLYRANKDKLVIIGFPSDNFGGQEFDNNDDIKEFCTKNYGVTFPLTTKVNVKGSDMTPVYQFLTSKKANGVLDAEVKWNFNKFLIDEKGRVVAYHGSKVKPDDDLIKQWVEK